MAETTLLLLVTWTIRATAFAGAVGILLWLFRTKDASVRLSFWTAALGGALLIPIVAATVPRLSISFEKPEVVQNLTISNSTGFQNVNSENKMVSEDGQSTGIKSALPNAHVWPQIAFGIWLAVCLVMLSRLILGLLLNKRLVREATPIENGLSESPSVFVPVTVGLLHPVILLPLDWREWSAAKLNAVLAHERAHVERRDTIRQFFSAIYKSVCWFNPLAWWLDGKLAALAESASDDAAISAINDPVLYAETLLGFLERAGQERVRYQVGVGMARMGNASKRIERILDSNRRLSSSITGRSMVVLTTVAVPLILFVASIEPGWAAKAFAPVTDSAIAQSSSNQSPDFTGAWYLQGNARIDVNRNVGPNSTKTGLRPPPPPPPIGKTERITREGDVLKISGGLSGIAGTYWINLDGTEVVYKIMKDHDPKATRTATSRIEDRKIITDWKMERDGKIVGQGQEIRTLSEDGKEQTIDSTSANPDSSGFKVHVVMKRIPMVEPKEKTIYKVSNLE